MYSVVVVGLPVHTCSSKVAFVDLLVPIDVCDPLSENPTSLHFLKLLFMTFLGKTNGLFKFYPYLISSVEIIGIDSRKNKANDLYKIIELKITGACLFMTITFSLQI